MKIPSEFFGTLKEVKSNCGKIITKLKRGATLEEIFEQSQYIDINDYPNSLIWLDRALATHLSEPQFFLMEFSYGLREKNRLTLEQLSRIKNENLEYLSSVDWGTLILNCSQAYFWVHEVLIANTLSRKGFEAIIKGTLKFWDEYMSIGDRFYTGAGRTRYFNQTLPLCGHVIAILGIDPRIDNKEDIPYTPGVPWVGNLKKLYLEAEVLEKIKNDDEYWRDVNAGKYQLKT